MRLTYLQKKHPQVHKQSVELCKLSTLDQTYRARICWKSQCNVGKFPPKRENSNKNNTICWGYPRPTSSGGKWRFISGGPFIEMNRWLVHCLVGGGYPQTTSFKEITWARLSEQWTYDSWDEIWISQLIISCWMQSWNLDILCKLSSQSWKATPKNRGVKIQLVWFWVLPRLGIGSPFVLLPSNPPWTSISEQLSREKRKNGLTFHWIRVV